MLELLKYGLQGISNRSKEGSTGTPVVDSIQFAQILLQTAEVAGFLECRSPNSKELRFSIGPTEALIYELPYPIFRPILAGVAVWVCSQDENFQGFEAFNVYGDSREIELLKGQTQGRFHVEILNRPGPDNFLRIRKLT